MGSVCAHSFRDRAWACWLGYCRACRDAVLPAGHLADRLSRKRIILVSQIFSLLTSASAGLGFLETSRHSCDWRHCVKVIASWRLLPGFLKRQSSDLTISTTHRFPLIYLLLFVGAVARTFSWAARSSFFPTLISRDAFASAVTWNNSVFSNRIRCWPCAERMLVAYIGFPFVYLLDALCALCFFFLILPIRRSKPRRDRARPARGKKASSPDSVLYSEKVILQRSPGFVRGPTGRRDRTDADFRRSDSALRTRLVSVGCVRSRQSAPLRWRWS